jgi:BirA family transcriptional regulator, biotin operon repressor / biotin---[acetyl-CoA-carboxylase] ligase
MVFDVEWVRSQLPDRRIEWHSVLDSTMTEASRLAAEDCAPGTVIGADQQTAGQGRLGRAWHSEPESGLYLSIVLRHSFSPNTMPVVTLALGLATAEAISKITDLACDLRWPNDVLMNGKKCAGILAQIEQSAIIAGIGINVNQIGFPKDIEQIATSLRLAGGRTYSREQLLVELACNVDGLCVLLQQQGPEPILNMFTIASSFVRGRRVHVDLGDSMLTGTTAGLNDGGFLILNSDHGEQNIIVAGGVRPCS